MALLEFWSEDDRFGLRVEEKRVAEILRLCRRSCPHETGGLVLGSYSAAHDCALVTAITKAPSDSRSGRTWFIRGVRGLQNKVDRLWRRRQGYYLGEWHFHPFGSPCPSPTDVGQMREIAQSDQYHCPEPVLLIVGGNPAGKWSARAFVFLRGRKGYLEMYGK